MTSNSFFQIIVYVVTLLVLAKPFGWYMARVYEGEPVGLNRLLAPVETLIYRSKRRESERGDALDGLCCRFSGI